MKIDSYLQEQFHYTDYQIQVLHYFFLSIWSELSKFFLLGLYFSSGIDGKNTFLQS